MKLFKRILVSIRQIFLDSPSIALFAPFALIWVQIMDKDLSVLKKIRNVSVLIACSPLLVIVMLLAGWTSAIVNIFKEMQYRLTWTDIVKFSQTNITNTKVKQFVKSLLTPVQEVTTKETVNQEKSQGVNANQGGKKLSKRELFSKMQVIPEAEKKLLLNSADAEKEEAIARRLKLCAEYNAFLDKNERKSPLEMKEIATFDLEKMIDFRKKFGSIIAIVPQDDRERLFEKDATTQEMQDVASERLNLLSEYSKLVAPEVINNVKMAAISTVNLEKMIACAKNFGSDIIMMPVSEINVLLNVSTEEGRKIIDQRKDWVGQYEALNIPEDQRIQEDDMVVVSTANLQKILEKHANSQVSNAVNSDPSENKVADILLEFYRKCIPEVDRVSREEEKNLAAWEIYDAVLHRQYVVNQYKYQNSQEKHRKYEVLPIDDLQNLIINYQPFMDDRFVSLEALEIKVPEYTKDVKTAMREALKKEYIDSRPTDFKNNIINDSLYTGIIYSDIIYRKTLEKKYLQRVPGADPANLPNMYNAHLEDAIRSAEHDSELAKTENKVTDILLEFYRKSIPEGDRVSREEEKNLTAWEIYDAVLQRQYAIEMLQEQIHKKKVTHRECNSLLLDDMKNLVHGFVPLESNTDYNCGIYIAEYTQDVANAMYYALKKEFIDSLPAKENLQSKERLIAESANDVSLYLGIRPSKIDERDNKVSGIATTNLENASQINNDPKKTGDTTTVANKDIRVKTQEVYKKVIPQEERGDLTSMSISDMKKAIDERRKLVEQYIKAGMPESTPEEQKKNDLKAILSEEIKVRLKNHDKTPPSTDKTEVTVVGAATTVNTSQHITT